MKKLSMKLEAIVKKVPWWVHGVFGLVLVALSVGLVLRPFNSLAIILLLIAVSFVIEGLRRIVAMRASSIPLISLIAGVGLVILGVLAAIWPSITIEVLLIGVVVVLLLGGLIDVASALRKTATEPVSAFFFGLSAIVCSFLVLMWPDITLLLVSVLFGVRMAIFGLSQLIEAVQHLRHSKVKTRQKRTQSPLLQWVRIIGSILLFLASVGLGVMSYAVLRAAPTPDSFYTYSGDIPDKPGKLLRVEPYTQSMPDTVDGWRILYSTTRQDGEPAVASAYVMAAKERGDTAQPVIAWAHGTTGVAPGCAPSVLPEPAPLSQAISNLPQVVEEGWVAVATDYVGMGTEGPHPYLVGKGEAHSVLDSIRAAQQMEEVKVENRTAVWGHSQGGHSALWTGGIAKEYAPELEIMGVAAASPASDLPALVKEQEESFFGRMLGGYMISAYIAVYPDIDLNTYVDPRVQLIIRQMTKRCVTDETMQVSAIMTLIMGDTIYRQDPTTGAFGERLMQNKPVENMDVPLLVAQGLKDELVDPKVQANYVKERCEAGQQLEYRTYKDDDHLSIVSKDSSYPADVLAWTKERLQERPVVSSCDQ